GCTGWKRTCLAGAGRGLGCSPIRFMSGRTDGAGPLIPALVAPQDDFLIFFSRERRIIASAVELFPRTAKQNVVPQIGTTWALRRSQCERAPRMPGQGWAFGGRGAGETVATVDSQVLMESRESGRSNQYVGRVVMMLVAFAGVGGDMGLGITKFSEIRGLAKIVVSRVVTPLVGGGCLYQNART